jgi:hypothetical protein
MSLTGSKQKLAQASATSGDGKLEIPPQLKE